MIEFSKQEWIIIGQTFAASQQRGAIRPDEMVPVGTVYQKVVAKINELTVLEQQAETPSEGEGDSTND